MDTKLCLTFDDMRNVVINHLIDMKEVYKLEDPDNEVEWLEFYPFFVTFRRTSLKTGLSYIESYVYPDLFRILILS